MRSKVVLILVLLMMASGAVVARSRYTPQPVRGPMILNWNPGLCKGGQTIVELQIYRDPGTAGSNAPFYVISNPLAIAQGYIDLTPLYFDGVDFWMEWPDRTVDNNWISFDKLSLIPMSCTWEAEACGTAHTYQMCAIVRKRMGRRMAYSYDFSSFRPSGTMTCIAKITADPTHVVMPQNGEPVLVSDLRSGDMNLRWFAAAGATEYRLTVKPVDPSIRGEWHSSIIYHLAGSGDEVCLSDADRVALASWLSQPSFADRDIVWRVDARNSGDTMPYWSLGDWCVFHIVLAPSGPP